MNVPVSEDLDFIMSWLYPCPKDWRGGIFRRGRVRPGQAGGGAGAQGADEESLWGAGLGGG